MEKEKTLMETSECNDIIDGAVGIVLTICTRSPRGSFPWTCKDGGESKG
jgi:hypothetical protein